MANSKYAKLIATATTVLCILLGIMFIVCCVHLYFTGGAQPYSRERVGDYLIILAVPSFITLALVVIGIVFNVVNGKSDVEPTARTSGELLESFTKKFDPKNFPEEIKAKSDMERDKRQVYSWLAFDISFLLFLLAVLYFDFFTSFSIDNLNGDVVRALMGILPLAILAVAVHIPKAYLIERSCQRELEILKNSIKENGAPRVNKTEDSKNGVDYALIGRYLIVGAAVALVILGIFNGGMGDVLDKAVKICTECIGLG